MDIVGLLLKQNVVMLFYLIVGYTFFKKKLIGLQGSSDMGKLLLFFIMPTAIIKSYLTDFSVDKLKGLLVSIIISLIALFLSIIISGAFFKKQEAVERFGVAFSNAGFIGIPMVQMTLGEEAVFFVASFVAGINILQWTYGACVMTGDRSAVSFKKISRNPIIISFLIGLALFFLPISLPDTLLNMAAVIASMNGPIAMIILGIYLAQIQIKDLFTGKTVYKASIIRLILIPIVTIIFMIFFNNEYKTIKLAILIAAAAPIGSNVAIFAQLYHQDYTRAVEEVCMSTLLCIVSLPVIIGIANYVF